MRCPQRVFVGVCNGKRELHDLHERHIGGIVTHTSTFRHIDFQFLAQLLEGGHFVPSSLDDMFHA